VRIPNAISSVSVTSMKEYPSAHICVSPFSLLSILFHVLAGASAQPLSLIVVFRRTGGSNYSIERATSKKEFILYFQQVIFRRIKGSVALCTNSCSASCDVHVCATERGQMPGSL